MEIDELTIGHRQSARPAWRRLPALMLGAAVLGLLTVAAHWGHPGGGAERGLLAPEPVNLQILLLGDSSAGKDTCTGWCFTYTEQLAASLERESNRRVRIEDRSWRGNTWPPSSVDSVLAYVRTDPGLRDVVRSTDVLVLALTDRNASATRAKAEASRHFGEQLDALLSEVSRVRHGQPLVLHVVVAPSPPTSHQAGTHATRAGCQVAHAHHGACVNLSTLLQQDLLAPADWSSVGGHPSLSQHGHDVVARELITDTGPGKVSTGAR